MQKDLIVDREVLLEKFPGKGGWTFARLEELAINGNNPFGWQLVCGFVDDFWFEKYHLMPMGNGSLFLPVRAEIRKKINKQAGDLVWVKLFEDKPTEDFLNDFYDCLREENLLEVFQNLPEKDKNQALEKIYSAKTANEQSLKMISWINFLRHKQTAI